MPVFDFANIEEKAITPRYSTAIGRLVTGVNVEVGMMRYKAGGEAKEHWHPNEQIMIVTRGRMLITMEGVTQEVLPGQAVQIPPNLPHSNCFTEDSEIYSIKNIVNGVGHRL